MPYNPAQERLFRAVAHGWRPADKRLQHLTQDKAKQLLDESESVTAQKRALQGMGTKGQTS
jgi:hypothetical protein